MVVGDSVLHLDTGAPGPGVSTEGVVSTLRQRTGRRAIRGASFCAWLGLRPQARRWPRVRPQGAAAARTAAKPVSSSTRTGAPTGFPAWPRRC